MAQTTATHPNNPPQGLPPLIDRELLFGNPEITAAELSPDGQYLAFMKPWKDTRNIWIKKTSEPFSSARLLTTETKRPIPGYSWTWDSKHILYVKDHDGDENFNVYSVDPAAAPANGAEAPMSRDLTGLKGVRVMTYSAPKTRPEILYIGLNDRDKSWHDLYELNLVTGQRKLIRENKDKIAQWFFDNDGQLRLAMHVAQNGDQEVLRVDADGLKKVYSCSVFDACGPVRFHKDGKRVYFETNKDADLVALTLFDPASEKVEMVEADPLHRVDFGAARFSEATDELEATTYVDDKTRRYFKNKAFEADFTWLEKQFPGRDIRIGSHTRDEKVLLITATGDTEPGETYLFDRPTRKLTLQYKIREQLSRQALSPMTTVRYKSSDGLEVPAYLTLPKGMPAKNLPTIVVPHGGPWARDMWGFNPLAQFFANRGYAVLMPNFRGSTGFGKKFLNSGNGEWGRKMQDDITYGVQYLTSQGIADPKRVGIMGGSYGGYATLAGVAFTPDVYRAAVDIVGPSNLNTLLDAIPPYWESGRKVMYTRMADPGTPEGKAWLKERSPLWAAAHIKTPLMVVQGANDPRVNRGEAEQIVMALRDRQFPVEYLLAMDEGHGFARPVNNMAMFMAIERFLAKHLDGRYQDGGTPETVAKLKELTIDPQTVTLTKRVDPQTIQVPKPARDPLPGTHHYVAKIEVGGQTMALKMTDTVAQEGGQWVVTESVETPMGNTTERTTLEKGTLVTLSTSAKQGPMAVDLKFENGHATGTMSMNGQDKPVSADLGGPLYGDGAGGLTALAVLPLAPGYTVDYRNFDMQKQKVKPMRLHVVSTEKVTVAAGDFTAFQVELTPTDGSAGGQMTLWIDQDTRKILKIVAKLPQMGGATMTSELQP